MEKTATLNLRRNPNVKQRAEDVLSRLGIPMSTAIDMYLNQISLTGGIPFPVTLPKAPGNAMGQYNRIAKSIEGLNVILQNKGVKKPPDDRDNN